MLRKEWSLIVNSLLVQLAAGMFIFISCYRMILAGPVDGERLMQLTGAGMAVTGPIVALGMMVSLLHLGNPFRAYRAVTNISSSWLSREIFFTGGFFVLWLAGYLMERNGNSSMMLSWAAMLAGVISVASMAGIYSSTGKAGWSRINTYTGFTGSIVIFGSIGSTVAVLYSGSSGSYVAGFLVISTKVACLVIAARLVQQILFFVKLKPGSGEWSVDNLVSAPLLNTRVVSQYKIYTMAGLILSLSGACITFVVLKTATPEQGFAYIAVSAFLVFAGEFIGRTAFYNLGLAEGTD